MHKSRQYIEEPRLKKALEKLKCTETTYRQEKMSIWRTPSPSNTPFTVMDPDVVTHKGQAVYSLEYVYDLLAHVTTVIDGCPCIDDHHDGGLTVNRIKPQLH